MLYTGDQYGEMNDDQYEEMNDDEREKWEYRQALQIQREQEKNSIHQRVAKGLTREEKQARREKNMAEFAAGLAKVIAIDDEPNDIIPPPRRLSPKEQFMQEIGKLEAAEQAVAIPKEAPTDTPEPTVAPIIEEVLIQVPQEAPSPEYVAPKMFNRGLGGLIELDAPSLKTLMILSTYQDANGKCDPSQLDLAKRMGISLRTVNSHIRKLLKFTTPDGSKILESVAEYKNRTSEYTHLIYQFLPASGFLNRVEVAEVVEAPTPAPDTFRLKSGSADPNKRRNMEFDEQFLEELKKLEKDFTPSDRRYSTFHNNRKNL